MRLGPDGRVARARYVASPNCDARPAGAQISLLVLHSISLPPGEFGGDAVERLFTNRLDAAAHPYFRDIVHSRVSAHFFVRRDGALLQFVPVPARLARGNSRWRGADRCNDSPSAWSSKVRRRAFAGRSTSARLRWREHSTRMPLRACAAHGDVARTQTDPASNFDWARFHAGLAGP